MEEESSQTPEPQQRRDHRPGLTKTAPVTMTPPTPPPLTTAPVDYNSPLLLSRAKARLMELGYAVNESASGYRLKDTLKRFQAANLNPDGAPLSVDGQFGPQTAVALFTAYRPPVGETLRSRVIAVAASMVGVTEDPPGSNRGPQIKMILKTTGLSEGYPWCSAFLNWCFAEAARQMLVTDDVYPNDAGVLNQWTLARYKDSELKRITADRAKRDPGLIKPGMAGLLKLGPTAGHIFLIESVSKDGRLTTIEGNTNQALAREGIGVFRLTRRTISSVNLGFIDYVND